MDIKPTNVYNALESFDEIYSPRIVNRLNDYAVKIAHTEGDYVWHSHDDTDEFFLVLDGSLEVALRDSDGRETVVELRKGDTFVVPRGVEHRPSSTGGAILMFEPTGTVSTGDVEDADLPDHIRSSIGQELS